MKKLAFFIIIITFLTNIECIPQELFNYNNVSFNCTPLTSLEELIFGKNWADIRQESVVAKEIAIDSLVFVNKASIGNSTLFIFSNRAGSHFYRFMPAISNIQNITPKLIYNTVSSATQLNLINSINPYAPLAAYNLLKPFYSNLTNLELVNLKKILPINDSSNSLVGYWDNLNNKRSILDSNYKSGNELLKYLENNPYEYVDGTEYLKFRLLELFMGNVNTSSNDIIFRREGIKWYPVELFSINSFPKFEGLFYLGGKFLVPSFITFSDNYKSPEDMIWKNRFLDKRILMMLPKERWDSTLVYVNNLLTPELIDSCCNNLPANIKSKMQQEIIPKLIERKNNLVQFGNEYYNYLNKYPEIYCSGINDSILVNRINNDSTLIEVFFGVNKSYCYESKKYFDNNITEEIRIYLGKGNDYCKLTGTVDFSPIIKIVGNDGRDMLVDSSTVKGYFLYVFPFRNDENKTYFFDSDKNSKFITSGGTTINPKSLKHYLTLDEKYDTEQRDFGHDWTFYPILELNTEEGLITGGGPILTRYNYGLLPYDYWMRATASYATQPKSYRITFDGVYNNVIPNSSLLLNFVKSELSYDKYFGYGNETVYNYHYENLGYYKSIYELINISLSVKKELFKNFSSKIGVIYEYSDISLNKKDLIKNFKYNNYGIGEFRMFGIISELCYDSRDNLYNPYSGFYFNLNGTLYPKLYRLEYPFLKTNIDIRAYKKFILFSPTVFAQKIGGGAMFGKYPFLKGVFIGGESLRGFSKNRFAGDYGFYSQTELRTQLTQADIIVKSKIGLNFFYDIGRVFIDGERSNVWHAAYGTGLWVDFFDRLFTVVTSIGFSNEKPEIYFATNFGF